MLRQRRSPPRPLEAAPKPEAADHSPNALVQAPAGAPANPSSAERLAAASGGTLMREVTGEATVVFPDGAGAASPDSPVATRRPRATERPIAEPFAMPATPGGASRTAPAEHDRIREGWREDLYDYVLERLRRDLLHERERSGHLVDDLF